MPASILLRTTLVLTSLSFAVPQRVVSQNRWERAVHDQLRRAIAAVSGGTSARPVVTRTEPLNEDEAVTIPVTLQRGVAYSILGVCDDDCSRLQLTLLTSANDEVALDRNSENLPILRFAPTVTMPYRIRLVMERCRVNPCWAGVAVVH